MYEAFQPTDRPPVQLPPGYRWFAGAEGWLALWEERGKELTRAGFGVATNAASRVSDLSGRRAMQELDLPGGPLVLRHFQHGGLFGGITRDLYLSPVRPFQELVLSEQLRAAGFLTPRVVAARAQRAGPLGWRLELLTERVEAACDLGFVIAEARAGRLTAQDRIALVRETGQLIARLHGVGFLHADLQPANLLWQKTVEGGQDQAPPRLWVLDLDGSSWRHPLSPSERGANLRRLWRNIERRDRDLGPSLTRRDRIRFLQAYDPLAWHQFGHAIESSRHKREPLHRLGHVLGGRKRIERDPRSSNRPD